MNSQDWQRSLERLLGRSLPPVRNPQAIYQTLVRFPDNDQRLLASVNSGDYDAVTLLIDAGVTNQALERALLEAVKWGLGQIVNLLLAERRIGRTVLDEALNIVASRGRFALVDRLISQGANVNNAAKPLVQAINNTPDALKTVVRLVDAGANIHVDDDFPLLIAVRDNLPTIASFLLEHGANVNASNGRAIAEALRQDNKTMILILVKHGAEIESYLPKELPTPIRKQIGGIFKREMTQRPRNIPLGISSVDFSLLSTETTAPSIKNRSPRRQSPTRSPKREIVVHRTPPTSPRNDANRKQPSTGSARHKTPPTSPRSEGNPKQPVISPRTETLVRKTPPASPRTKKDVNADERRKCVAMTKGGTQCSFRAKEGSLCCGKHQSTTETTNTTS